MERIWRVLTRKKAIDPVNAEETRLNRVLNTFDLTALGIGSTLGVGVYVLAGQVAKDTAGPSVILSFFIAAVTSVFAGLCYAEFGARAPRAGSAYIYSYVCVGEFIAFVIGWNLILEYVIGAASVARGLSLYLDTLVNGTIQDTFRHIAPINVEYMSEYFDFLSFGLSILLAVALAFGMKESSMGNNIVTVLNIFIVLFIIVAGSLKADISNWNVSPNSTNTTANIGNGGFFPFGIEGMIKGAATCFYGFVGFDCIATTGEEVMNPRKAIPVSIIVSLFIIFCAYFGTATVLTLMVPYYLQDHDAPIPRAFEMVGWDWAKWVVAIGALCGLCASLFGAMFPLPRVIYAMGSDGLVFKFLAKVHPKFQTPVIGTIFAGILTGLMSALFNLNQLVNMMSIGTLLAYTIVAASVLLLRYKEDVKKVYTAVRVSSDTESTNSESSDVEKYDDDVIRQNFDGPSTSDETELINNEQAGCCNSLFYIFNYKSKEPSKITENIVAVEVFLFCILCVCIGLCVIYLKSPIIKGEIWAIAISSVVVGITVLLIISISTQPTSKKELSFKVPLVPLIPALSILVNIYLMLMLDSMTWIRFAVWMAIGTPMYLLCACSNEPHTTHTKGTYFSANITNGQPTSLNGFSNPSFEIEQGDSSTIKSPTKKKKMAPTPPDLKRVQSVDVQPDTVIAQLDQVLEKVTLSEWEEDGLSDETSRISSRKLSAGSVSNLSVVVSNRENVIADVHHADLAPIPNLKSPSVHDIPTIEKCDSEIVEVCEEVLPLTKANDKNEHQNFTPLQEYSIELEHGDENLPVALNNDATSNKIAQMQNPNESTFSKFNEDDRDKKSGNQDKNNEEINKSNEGISKISMNEIRHDTFQGHVQDVTKIEDKILEGSDENNFDILDQNITKTDKESSILNEEFLKITVDKNIETGGNQNYIDIGNKPNDYESSKSNELITKKPLHKNPPDIDNDNNINSSLATQFIDNTSNHPPAVPSQKPDNASNFKVETQTTPITPTEEALKSVTLRHVKSVIKNIIPTLNQNASDSNLKAGSDQYKFFSENLNNKLKVRPRVAFFPVIQTHVVTVPKEVKFKHNEDVIEEQIDREGAKVKLQEFLKNDSARNFMNESTKYNDIKNGSSENVDNSFIKKSEEDPDTGLKNRDESGLNHKDESELKDADDSGFMEHQNKMKKVFSSMKLKNSNNEVQTRRLSKSLGSSFIKEDHHGAHRQKMGDIFKSIHALKTED